MPNLRYPPLNTSFSQSSLRLLSRQGFGLVIDFGRFRIFRPDPLITFVVQFSGQFLATRFDDSSAQNDVREIGWIVFQQFVVVRNDQDPHFRPADFGNALAGQFDGINVEALSATSDGNLLIGFRGPVTADGGTLALEIKLPPTADDEPVLVKAHVLPALNSSNIPKGAAKTLRAISMVPDEVGHFYVLLGPKGYEKEELVLARWDLKTGKLTKATVLPKNFVAEGVTPIPGGKVLVVDDLKEAILVATEH